MMQLSASSIYHVAPHFIMRLLVLLLYQNNQCFNLLLFLVLNLLFICTFILYIPGMVIVIYFAVDTVVLFVMHALFGVLIFAKLLPRIQSMFQHFCPDVCMRQRVLSSNPYPLQQHVTHRSS